MQNLIQHNPNLLRGPIAIIADEDEGANRAVVVLDLDGIDGHCSKTYRAIEAISLTSTARYQLESLTR